MAVGRTIVSWFVCPRRSPDKGNDDKCPGVARGIGTVLSGLLWRDWSHPGCYVGGWVTVGALYMVLVPMYYPVTSHLAGMTSTDTIQSLHQVGVQGGDDNWAGLSL